MCKESNIIPIHTPQGWGIGGRMKHEQYDVTGMTCAACSLRVEKSVKHLAGVNGVSVNLLKNSMVVDYDEKACS